MMMQQLKKVFAASYSVFSPLHHLAIMYLISSPESKRTRLCQGAKPLEDGARRLAFLDLAALVIRGILLLYPVESTLRTDCRNV